MKHLSSVHIPDLNHEITVNDILRGYIAQDHHHDSHLQLLDFLRKIDFTQHDVSLAFKEITALKRS